MVKTKKVNNSQISLYPTVELGLTVGDGGKWVLICEDHGSILQDNNKKRLWGWANTPDTFCELCRDKWVPNV